MSYFILTLLIIVIWLDARIFRRENEQMFLDVFRVSGRFVILTAAIFLAIMIFDKEAVELLPNYFMVFALPVYLWRRDKIVRAVSSTSLTSDAYGVILFWTFGSLVIAAVVESIFAWHFDKGLRLAEIIVSTVFSSVFLLGLVYFASRKFSSNGFFYNLGVHPSPKPVYGAIFLPALIGIFFAFVSVIAVLARDIQPSTPLGDIIAETQSVPLIFLFIVVAIIFAPFVEEIVFRGYFFHVIKDALGERSAFYMISIIFAALHVGQYWGDWMAISAVTVLGFALTFTRIWAQSTTPSIIMHYAYNIGVAFIPAILLSAGY